MTKEKKSMAKHMFGKDVRTLTEFVNGEYKKAWADYAQNGSVKDGLKIVKKDK